MKSALFTQISKYFWFFHAYFMPDTTGDNCPNPDGIFHKFREALQTIEQVKIILPAAMEFTGIPHPV
jgi:hypothetical protein